MIPPRDPRVVQTALNVTTHQPWFVEHLQACYEQECEKLIFAKGDFAVQQGRVQMLADVLKMFHNAAVDAQRMKT